MSTGQRAFAQKLSKQHAADVRRQVVTACVNQGTSKLFHGGISSSIPLCDTVDPVDYEDYVQQHELLVDRDPIGQLLEFPSDDVDVTIIPRKCRTVEPIVPEENVCELDTRTKDCLRCYTSDWVVTYRRYQHLSSSYSVRNMDADRTSVISSTRRQEFEVDFENSSSETLRSCSQQSLGDIEDSDDRQSQQFLQLGDTPRSSWASSDFDLRNSASDPLIPTVLERAPSEHIDQLNEARRLENRQESLFALYPAPDEDEPIERRLPAEPPCEQLGHRISVKCLNLKLELEIEPIFASMALYDAKEKKKISENFYFDMNSEQLKRMLDTYVPYTDISSMSRACVFNITHPTPDIFLVIKLEKALQGDINECVEPYLKDDKNRDKVRANAVACCERLGKYRMPFAWTAIYLVNIVNGVNSLERDSSIDREGGSSSSLERKPSAGSFEGFRRKTNESGGTLGRHGSLERRGALEKRNSWSPEEFGNSLDTFRPVTLTVSSFFKQETDKLCEDDLYKFLADLKRPSSVSKRLKCIPGILKLDISPCIGELPYCLTPELTRLNPYPEGKCRPIKEILEFPCKEVYVPHYTYRNLMYVYPKNLNFTNRSGSARNITCKVQLMAGEDPHNALNVLYGHSNCPEFCTEAYTAVSYHNRCPDFYDEIKIKLPAKMNDHHHLLFTFYHISCQRKVEQIPVETPIGYTWLPVYRDSHLQTGESCLPVSVEKPPANYSMLSPDVNFPGTKWVDNHKGLFTVVVSSVSAVHTQDKILESFLNLCSAIEDENIPPRIGDANVESELKTRTLNLVQGDKETLVKFLPLILDKLIELLVRPPSVAGDLLNSGQTAFESMANIVCELTALLDWKNDQHGRNSLLATYIQYQCKLPHPDSSMSENYGSYLPPYSSPIGRPISMPIAKSNCSRSTSNPDLARRHVIDSDAEVGMFTRGLDRTSSMRTGSHENALYLVSKGHIRKLVHEELALQWVVSSGTARENSLSNAWFFFELMSKSMMHHLAVTGNLTLPRKLRFSEQFTDDLATLITTMTSDIISRYNREEKDMKVTHTLNNSLAFFSCDLLSIMDRGYVFSLVKTYIKQLTAKIASLPDATILVSLKLNFLRIICSHEHFVALNLPFGTPIAMPFGTSSPCLSTTSSASQGSHISGCTSSDHLNTFTELSPEFRQHHFLVGLVLSDLAAVLEMNNHSVQSKAVNTVRNLLTNHDCDPRYLEPECRSRVAALYLPLVGIVMDTLPHLHDWHSEIKDKGRHLSILEENESDRGINRVANAIAGSYYGKTISPRTEITYELTHYTMSHRSGLSAETTQNLLMCFLWVVKNADSRVLRQWWANLSLSRLQQLLEVLFICVSCFEYKGKLLKCYPTPSFCTPHDIKSKLEDVILRGQGSARSEMMRRRDKNPPSQNLHEGFDKLRWRKDQTQWRYSADQYDNRPKIEAENDYHLQGNLATECNMVILDTLELVVQVASQLDNLQGLLGFVLRVLLHGLACNQSTAVLQNMFATQRSLVFKFPGLLFDEETEQCADLCLRLLHHCSSSIGIVRSQASASLYLLMRQNFEIGNNFARVKMQVTMSLSALVGTSKIFNEDYLRRSLKTILTYAEEDIDLQETTFPVQVKDLVFNLHMILSDTVKMKEVQEDPEMLLDLMYRIAKGYQNSPDLRLTWLANMAQKHTERNNQAEAAHCLLHSAALVAEYLHMLEYKIYLPIGAVSFQALSSNVLEESAVSDDVVSPDEEGTCTGKYFSENGLVGLLEQAANSFNLAGMYEAMNGVYKILIPIAEANRDFKRLANIHSKLHDAFTKIEQQAGKRVFGSYFRVGFYGSKFGDLDNQEFIYKEPTLTKLPEISHRLQGFYSERFGSEFVEVVKDSNTVIPSKLNPEKAYIQITYVEPYFDLYELRDRVTYFDKNYNIKRFIYATPFTLDGRAHGELHEQHKRKTVLTTINSFPYVKTRIQVGDKQQVVLTPIEVAIEDIQKKTLEVAFATRQDPPDPKILQMVLQGSLGTQVNQGPLEIALVFLTDLLDGQKVPTKHQNKLRLCFKDFCLKCADALHRNKSLIGPDQRDYQRELDRNYGKLKEKLAPMLNIMMTPAIFHRQREIYGMQKHNKTSPFV